MSSLNMVLDTAQNIAETKVKKNVFAKLLIPVGIIAFLLFFVPIFFLTLIIGVTPGPMTGFRSGSPTAFANEEIPAEYMPIFFQAQDKYGVSWAVLAAIAREESRFGANMAVSSAGAIGFMQFMPPTWEEYKQDGNNDGMHDPYDPWDAIFSAANYLMASGFDKNPEKAVFAYNHDNSYVKAVMARAEAYSSTQIPITVATTTPDGTAVWPLPDKYTYISSPYGNRLHPTKGIYKLHDGIDLPAPTGTPILAVQDGQIVWCQYKGDYGLTVTISHGTYQTMYCHMSNIATNIKHGVSVKAGDVIGFVGNTGVSTAPHLHFSVYVNGQPTNPEEWLQVPSDNY